MWDRHQIVVDPDEVAVDLVRVVRTVLEDVAAVLQRDAGAVVASELAVGALQV
jgi:hypothetical protein